MRNHNLFYRLSIFIILIFFVITACTPSGITPPSGGDEPATQAAATTAATTAAAAEPATAAEAGGDAGGSDADRHVEFTHYWDFSWFDDNNQTEITAELMRRTNTTINIERPATDDGQKLNIMMSSGNLPDVITCDRTIAAVVKLIDAKKVYCITDLMEKYAPSMLTDIEPEYFQYHKYTDGKNYYWTNYIYTPFVMAQPDYPKIDAVFTTSMLRTDIWDAIGKPDVTTPDKYLDMLNMVKDQFPDVPTYYFMGFPDNGGLFMNSDSPGYGMFGEFGVHKYDVADDGAVTSSVRSDNWIKAAKFMNQIFRNGCFAAESFVDDNDTRNQKVNNGEVGLFHASIANHAYLPGVDYTPLPYFKNEGSKFVKSGAGWLATMVTTDAKDLQGIMDLFAYCCATEGRRLVSWGIENRHWEWSKDDPNEPVKTALWDQMEDPSDYTKKWGFWQYRCFHDQYYCNSLFEKWTPERLAWYEIYGDVMELDIFDGVRNPPLDDSTEGVILAKLNETAYNYYPKLVMASSDAEFDKTYNEFISRCDDQGLPVLEQFWTKKFAQFQ